MKIKKIDHIAINTKDIKVSTAFYRDILGFKPMDAIENGDSTITYFMLPDGSRLELFDYKGRNEKVSRSDSDTGLRHLAFEVEDVEAHQRELKSKGVNIVLPTTDLRHLGAKVLLFSDPDGAIIEFCQKLS